MSPPEASSVGICKNMVAALLLIKMILKSWQMQYSGF